MTDTDIEALCEQCNNLVSGVYKTSCKSAEGVEEMFLDIARQLSGSNRCQLLRRLEIYYTLHTLSKATCLTTVTARAHLGLSFLHRSRIELQNMDAKSFRVERGVEAEEGNNCGNC